MYGHWSIGFIIQTHLKAYRTVYKKLYEKIKHDFFVQRTTRLFLVYFETLYKSIEDYKLQNQPISEIPNIKH